MSAMSGVWPFEKYVWCVSCVYGLHRLDSGVLKRSIPALAGPPAINFS